MALITTFASSPLTMYFYPPWYQKKVEAWKRGEIDWDTGKPIEGAESVASINYEKLESQKVRRMTIYLRLDSMPNLLAFASLFGGQAVLAKPKLHPSVQQAASTSKDSEASDVPPNRPVEAYGLRLLNLTDRGSSVMQVSEIESYTAYDPVVNTFRTFGRMHNLAVSGEVLVVPENSFADTLSAQASDSDFLLIPWSETGGMSEQAVIEDKGTKNKLAASSYLSFVNETFEQATITTAVLVNKNFGGSKNKDKKEGARLARTYSSVSLGSHREKNVTAPLADRSHHIFVPFFGGEDDRAALRLVLQMAENPEITATLVYFEVSEAFLEHTEEGSSSSSPTKDDTLVTSTSISHSRSADTTFFASLRASLPSELSNRVVFEVVPSNTPLKDVLARASIEVGQSPKNGGDLIVLGRNVGRKGLHVPEITEEIRPHSSAAGTLGVLAEKIWEEAGR
jgi:hypothetical protein